MACCSNHLDDLDHVSPISANTNGATHACVEDRQRPQDVSFANETIAVPGIQTRNKELLRLAEPPNIDLGRFREVCHARWDMKMLLSKRTGPTSL